MRQTLDEYIEGRLALGGCGLWAIGIALFIGFIAFIMQEIAEHWIIWVCVLAFFIILFLVMAKIKGLFDKPKTAAEEEYEKKKRKLGEKHRETITALNALAREYDNRREREKALPLYEKVYALRCEVLGKEHVETIVTLRNIATTYANLGDGAKAVELYEEVYPLYCKEFGEEHERTVSVLSFMGVNYSNKLHNFERAYAAHKKAYEIRCRTLGVDHDETLRSQRNLALAYGNLGRYEESAELLKKLYEIVRKKFGVNHSNTKYIYDEWQAAKAYTKGKQ